jgi:hypothetical protein
MGFLHLVIAFKFPPVGFLTSQLVSFWCGIIVHIWIDQFISLFLTGYHLGHFQILSNMIKCAIGSPWSKKKKEKKTETNCSFPFKVKHIINRLTSHEHPNQTEQEPPFFYFMLCPSCVHCMVGNIIM